MRKSNWYYIILSVVIIPILIVVFLWLRSLNQQPEFQIDNPYASVNWLTYGQYKANFHTHTAVGGTSTTPEEVILLFRDLGYSILAITDHDTDSLTEPTWPGHVEGINPDSLEMVIIQGNEISNVHHIGSLFNNYGDSLVVSENEIFEEIRNRDGLALFHHPGRYDKSVDWYVDMFRQYTNLLGLEVYNKRDRYPYDRQTWDAILTELLPERPVWGFANDDMHKPEEELGFSWNVFILPDLNTEIVRHAIEEGWFYYVHSPKGQKGAPVPVIESITVDGPSGSIDIRASGYDSIRWISQGNIVFRGENLKLADLIDTDKYVRAEIFGQDSTVLGTQPFQFSRSVVD